MPMTLKPSQGWLLFLYTLPAKKATGRVNLWRKLKKMGACPLRTSAYVLPDEPVHVERFQWLAQQVCDHGGEATLARVTNIEGLSSEALACMFNDARAEDYATVQRLLGQLIAAHRRKVGEEFAGRVEKLRKQFQEIRAIDYFDCPAAHEMEMLFQRADRLTGPRTKTAATLDARRFQRRVWLTRPRPEIDRVGSAWLIHKFIDARATFVFATTPSAYPDALPYDMVNVEFTHHGDDCTFETLLKRFSVSDQAAGQIGEMIHDADLEDGKFQRAECVGLGLLFKGWARLGLDDAKILEKGFACFDALHAALRKKA